MVSSRALYRLMIKVRVNILVTRNRESGNLGIRVLVPGNHLFVLDYSSYFYGNICQGLAASAVRSSLYKYPCRNYDSVCTKVNLKSDFHISGQLMETHPEYSKSAWSDSKTIHNRSSWALIQTHLNSTNNSVVVLHKNASFRNLKIMTTKKL